MNERRQPPPPNYTPMQSPPGSVYNPETGAIPTDLAQGPIGTAEDVGVTSCWWPDGEYTPPVRSRRWWFRHLIRRGNHCDYCEHPEPWWRWTLRVPHTVYLAVRRGRS